MTHASQTHIESTLLASASQTARLIAELDWSATLGPPSVWPSSLKTAVGILLHSPVPIVLLWGEDGIMIYNDAYAVFAGGRHPTLLGSRVREGWPEVADFNDNVMKVGLAGGTLSYKDQELTLHRSGKPEQVWMNLDYSPVIDESGRPGGVVAIVVETTQRVLAERQMRTERERLARMFRDAPSFMAQLEGPSHVIAFVNEAYQRLIGHRDVVGKPIREALPEVEGQGFHEVLDRLYASGESFRGEGLSVKLQRTPGGPTETRLVDFIYQPVRDAAGCVSGIFVDGIDVTEARRAEARRDALARLSDIVRDLDDPDAIQFAAVGILGQTLGVSRVGYGSIDPDTDMLTVARDWCLPGVESLAGSLHLREYGSFVDDLKRGAFIAIADVEQDSRTAAAAAALTARSARSFVNEPVLERGRLVAVLFINHAEPRDWQADDLAFIREVAARTRLTSERARGARAQRENERRLRFLDALGKETARSLDADAILATTTRMLGEFLGVSICAYADMDADEDGFTIRGDWVAPGSSTIVGRYRLADFGRRAVENLSVGLPLIVNDNLAELAPEEAAAFRSAGIAATLCMPLVIQGRLTALIAIHDRAPRNWASHELALLTEVTQRSWAHVERARAEAEIRANEAQFRILAQALPNHVWTSNPDGRLDWFNDRVYAYSGAGPGDLDGAEWASIVHRDDVAEVERRWQASVTTGSDYEVEFRLRRHDGVWRWHIARAVALRDEDGSVVRWIGTNTDVDDQKNAEALLEQRLDERTAALAEAGEQLRQSQKMEAVGQLTGGIAHDFNNLLQAIIGSLDRIQHRIATGRIGDVERFAKAATDAANRAATLTHRLLAFSRRQTLDSRPTDLNRLIGGMEDLVRRTVGPDIAVEVTAAGGLWLTRVDPSQLESALLNLCINARDAMPGGGTLTIRTVNEPLDEEAAKERDLAPGEYVSLCVSDTGVGMTADTMSRAFDPFFTTKPLGQGTGLGLSMIYGFVRQSGGQVRVKSEVGRGSTFRLFLPRFLGEMDRLATATEEAVEEGDGETVLVVDDEATVRMLVQEVLTEARYRVIEAIDGPSALEIIQSGARIDLMITDVGLPGGINGQQLAEAVRTHRKDLKVLLITGYAQNAGIGTGIGEGRLPPGMELMTKPFAMQVLANKVRQMLEV